MIFKNHYKENLRVLQAFFPLRHAPEIVKGDLSMARDMTGGNITKHMLFYAVPLVFGNLFQQLYHTVDSVVVGQYYGKTGLAALGAAGPIMNILTFLIVGISMGTSILMARYFGAKSYEEMREEMGTSLTAGALLTAVLMILSYLGSGFFIWLTRTPEEIADSATVYLRIISIGLFFTFLYNLFSAALRAIGDSKAPLYVLILTTLVNVFLDIFLVGLLRMGVPGAALATIISQAVSGLALVVYIYVKVPLLQLKAADLKLNRDMLKLTVDFSSVSAVQQTTLYVGRLLVQSGVNSLGVDAVAAFNAVSIIDSYVLAPGDSLAASITTFTAQNLGGKKYRRIPQGLKCMFILAEVYTITVTVLVLLGRNPLLGIFLKPEETEAIRHGLSYLIPMASFYFLSGLNNTWQGYYRGLGRLKVTLSATLVQIPIRVVFTYLLLGFCGIQAVAIGTAIGWSCMFFYELSVYRKSGRVVESA